MGYYYDNQAQIDAEITAELVEVDRMLEADARSAVWLELKAQRDSGVVEFVPSQAVAPRPERCRVSVHVCPNPARR